MKEKLQSHFELLYFTASKTLLYGIIYDFNFEKPLSNIKISLIFYIIIFSNYKTILLNISNTQKQPSLSTFLDIGTVIYI